jgi:hypothetical protein
MLIALSNIGRSTVLNASLNLTTPTPVERTTFSSSHGKTVWNEEQKRTSQADKQVYARNDLSFGRPKNLVQRVLTCFNT